VLLTSTKLCTRKDDAGRLTEVISETIDGGGVRFSGIICQGTIHPIAFNAKTGPEKRRFPLSRRSINGVGRWNRKPDGENVIFKHIDPATPLYWRHTSSCQKNWPKRLN
jgi:hypothetical protein